MTSNLLYSLVLELRARTTVDLPGVTGHQVHALFLNLIHRVEPELAARLHDDPEYRPFTVSPLLSAQGDKAPNFLSQGQRCRLRLTLLDGGEIWQHLNQSLQENRDQPFVLDQGMFTLERVLATPASDPTGWANWTTWQQLAMSSPQRTITLCFTTPTAFHLGARHFVLFPEPALVWDSLVRKWNLYAPEVLHIEPMDLRWFVEQQMLVSDYTLSTTTLSFPRYSQKGFTGVCTYLLKGQEESRYGTLVSCLAEFARYAGVGYKTTMGMGQTQAIVSWSENNANREPREIREARL